MLLLDVQTAAFDSVNHKILCCKLKAMAHFQLSSYLTNRQQLVCIDSISSDLKHLPCGIPQGS